jgi:hypothetical protein
MKSVVFYNSVSVKLASWLDHRGISHNDWLKFLLRENVDPKLMNAADELQESAGSSDTLNSPIFTREEWFFEASRLKLFLERRASKWISIGRKGDSAHYASTELIARVVVKWIQMNDRAEKFFNDPSAV